MSDITISDLSVYLIEPSSMQQQIISNYLKGFGITHITTYKNAVEALKDLSHYTPDLVISAMHMQDMSGTELVQTMRQSEKTLDIPFMLISSETS
ncbi:MAG: response regulator, partial [Gammaproteobacteria bacterium]|nr:response regulator [Gammaproteobacteria bacterium]